jgi:hypothetical protein
MKEAEIIAVHKDKESGKTMVVAVVLGLLFLYAISSTVMLAEHSRQTQEGNNPIAVAIMGLIDSLEKLPSFHLEDPEPVLLDFPLEQAEVNIRVFPATELIGNTKLEFLLEEYDIEDMTFVYPIDEETGFVLLESRRTGWEFSQETKTLAWEQAVRRGDIPADADPADYQFHHKVPVEIAREWEMPQSLITSVANCIPLHRDDHVELHRFYTNEELARLNIGLLEEQYNLFEWKEE